MSYASEAFLQELWMQWHLAQQAQQDAIDGVDRVAAESRLDNLRDLALRNDVDLRLLDAVTPQPAPVA
ncbi:MAG: hypothetical protein ACTHMZ_11365 [Actinomycetes bacterium]